MAKEKKVEQITDMEVDFAQWYTDVCRKAELVEYASVKGFTILRPYGYAIWENMQRIMDGEFKKTGHENVAMPVLIPESLLKKEGELVNGFAPEVAWVTMGGSEKLEERLAFRPTSETMFCDHWSNILQTYRQLPMLYNQWCSVIRWEKTTRPFLRSREFWWQEGHTIHETAEEAKAETEQQLKCYADFFENVLAIPVVPGQKTEKEKFAGAEATYTVECMMKDHKALQGATSHYFGDKFSRAYNVTFTGRDNKQQYPFQTSWGSTTRMIGAVIMTHGDNNGLVLPPKIAPIQVIILPIAQHKPGVLEAAAQLKERVDGWTMPLNILFFVISGAELDLNVLSQPVTLIVGIIYIIARSAGKYCGANLSCRITKEPKSIVDHLGITLLPQAGVALGMAITAASLSDGTLARNVVLFAVLVYELVGPTLTKRSLLAVGEIRPEGRTNARKQNDPNEAK